MYDVGSSIRSERIGYCFGEGKFGRLNQLFN